MADPITPPAQNAPASDLQRQWSDYFKNPAVISGLLQFGATALTPGQGIGPALSQGAAAATRSLQFQQAGQAAQTAAELKRREVGAKERTAGAAERRARAAEITAGKGDVLGQQRLDLEKRRLEEYLIPSLKNRNVTKPLDPTRMIFQGFLDQAMDAQFSSELPEDDPLYIEMTQDPVGYAIRMTAAQGGRTAGSTAVGGSPVVGASAGNPPPEETGEVTEVTPEGVPPFEQVTDEQWSGIAANPVLSQQATAVYGARGAAKLQQMRDRASMPGGGGLLQGLGAAAKQLGGR